MLAPPGKWSCAAWEPWAGYCSSLHQAIASVLSYQAWSAEYWHHLLVVQSHWESCWNSPASAMSAMCPATSPVPGSRCFQQPGLLPERSSLLHPAGDEPEASWWKHDKLGLSSPQQPEDWDAHFWLPCYHKSSTPTLPSPMESCEMNSCIDLRPSSEVHCWPHSESDFVSAPSWPPEGKASAWIGPTFGPHSWILFSVIHLGDLPCNRCRRCHPDVATSIAQPTATATGSHHLPPEVLQVNWANSPPLLLFLSGSDLQLSSPASEIWRRDLENVEGLESWDCPFWGWESGVFWKAATKKPSVPKLCGHKRKYLPELVLQPQSLKDRSTTLASGLPAISFSHCSSFSK